jgi:excinuclease UvrABC nuclease subunit
LAKKNEKLRGEDRQICETLKAEIAAAESDFQAKIAFLKAQFERERIKHKAVMKEMMDSVESTTAEMDLQQAVSIADHRRAIQELNEKHSVFLDSGTQRTYPRSIAGTKWRLRASKSKFWQKSGISDSEFRA